MRGGKGISADACGSRSKTNRRNSKATWMTLSGAVAGIALNFAASKAGAQVNVNITNTWSIDPAANATATLTGTATAPLFTWPGGGSVPIIAPITPTTLQIGSTITFSGTALFPTPVNGNEQFRFGIYNANSPGSSDLGWTGYQSFLPNAGNNGHIGGLNGTSNWYAEGGSASISTPVTNPTEAAPGSPTTDAFSISVTYNSANNMTVEAQMIGSDGIFTYVSTGTDTTTTSDGNVLYNEVGMFFGGSTLGATGTITFSNMAVNYNPGPSTWGNASGGDWGTGSNWTDGFVPGVANSTADFYGAISTNQTVTLTSASETVGIMNFNNSAASYTITAAGSNTLTLSNGGANGTADINDLSGNHSITAPVILASNLLATVTNSTNTFTINGAISGTGGVSVAGAGTLALGGSNSYTGATNINAGTLALKGGSITGTSLINVNSGATFNVSTASPAFALSSTQTMEVNGTTDSIVGNVTSAGILQPHLTSTTTNYGTMNFANNLTLSGGSINLNLAGGSTTTTGSGTNDEIIVNGTLNLSSQTQISPTFAATAQNPSTYDIMSYASLTGSINNLIATSRSFTIGDTGSSNGFITLTVGAPAAANLTWASTSSGAWDVVTSENWYNPGKSGPAGTPNDDFYQADNVTFADGSGLQTSITLNTAVSPTSFTDTANTHNYSFTGSGSISGSTGITLTGNSTLTLATNNNYTGTTSITGGTIQVGNGVATTGSLGTGPVTDAGTLAFDLPAPLTVANVISGNGVVVMNGTTASSVTLTGSNTYSGNTNINDGVVFPSNLAVASTSGPFGNGTGTVTVNSGAEIYSVIANTIANPIVLNGTGVSSEGALRGGGSTTSTFTGTVTLASNTTINVDAGANVDLNNANAVSDSGNYTLTAIGGGTVNFGGNVNLGSGALLVSGTVGFDPAASTTITMSSAIQNNGTNAGNISMNGGGAVGTLGTAVLSVNSSYSGTTTLNNGVLEVTTSGGLGTSAIVFAGFAATGELGLANGVNISNSPVTFNGRSVIDGDIDNISGTNTFSSNINYVTSGDDYGFESDAGTLVVAGSFTSTVASTSRFLYLLGAGNGVVTGVISDPTVVTGSLTVGMNGTGTWTLDGANAFSGGLNINSGTLAIGAAGGMPNGEVVTIAGGQLLVNASASPTSISDTTSGGTGIVQVGAAGNLTVNTVNGTGAGGDLGSLVNNGTTTITNSGVIGSVSGTGTTSLGIFATLTAGNFTQGGLALASGSSATITGSGTTGQIAGSGGSLTVGNGSTNTLVLAHNSGQSTLASLSIANTTGSALDITNNSVLIDYSSDPKASILGYLATGANGGSWNGTGIISSTAAANPNYGVGYADGADGVDSNLTSGQLEVAYVQYGDITLSGLVNAQDFSILSHNFGKIVTGGWEQGDFLYSGTVNAEDFHLLTQNFGKTETGEDIASAADWQAVDAFAAANGLQSEVPEPASLGLLAVTGLGLLARRRRKSN